MRKKLTRTQKQYIAAALASITVITAGFGVAYATNMQRIKNSYQTQIQALESEILTNKKVVYVADGKIPAGSKIGLDNVREQETLLEQNEKHFISSEDFGKLAVIDIKKGQAVTKNMLTPELPKGLREEEFSLLKLNRNLKENDLVDIRVRFPNGENYIVLSKKSLKNLDLETGNCFLWLEEQETLMMSAAIVDAYLHDGATLYTTKYIESGQEASEITYEPNESVMLMMANDPNILEEAKREMNLKARQELEERLKTFEAEHQNMPGNTSETGASETKEPQTGAPEEEEEAKSYTVDGEVDYID